MIRVGVKTISSHRPLYTIGPESDVPSMTLTGISEPWGVTVGVNNDIYIASKKDKKIIIYDGHGHKLREEISELIWESPQNAKDMANLSDIAVCEDGCLLISIQNQLVKITLDGLVLASVGKRGERGRRDDQLDKPNGIAIGREGQIYVADQGNHRIQIFNADLTYKSTCSFPDHVRRTDICPEKIAINSAGYSYVTDSKNACVYVFNESGQFLFTFGRKGSLRDRGSLSSPTAIAIDSEDYVYISESNVGVSIFDSNGNFMKAFSVCEKSLGNVKAMHIDTRGNLYVCESRNNCVCTFSGNKTQQN
jgi:DNA-binding beta-propeller fold protein YncE